MSKVINEEDKIYIRDLSVNCVIGIYKEEREKKQNVNINVVLYSDLSEAAKSDAITDALDYKTIKKEVMSFTENSSFFLIEKLASEIASLCLKNNKVKRKETLAGVPWGRRKMVICGVCETSLANPWFSAFAAEFGSRLQQRAAIDAETTFCLVLRSASGTIHDIFSLVYEQWSKTECTTRDVSRIFLTALPITHLFLVHTISFAFCL